MSWRPACGLVPKQPARLRGCDPWWPWKGGTAERMVIPFGFCLGPRIPRIQQNPMVNKHVLIQINEIVGVYNIYPGIPHVTQSHGVNDTATWDCRIPWKPASRALLLRLPAPVDSDPRLKDLELSLQLTCRIPIVSSDLVLDPVDPVEQCEKSFYWITIISNI